MRIENLNNSALMFVGVNEGYDGDAMNLKDPEEAAHIVSMVVSAAHRFLTDSNEYECLSGIAIYPPKWGCLIGGEPVAAVLTNGSAENAIKMARYLQTKFRQEELTLAMFNEAELGKETLNFYALLDSSLREFGKIWQEVAGNYHDEHGIYVSVGAYEVESGIIISAQANHDFKVDFSDWEKAAKNICVSVGDKIGKEICPEFSQVRYIYLDSHDLARTAEARAER